MPPLADWNDGRGATRPIATASCKLCGWDDRIYDATDDPPRYCPNGCGGAVEVTRVEHATDGPSLEELGSADAEDVDEEDVHVVGRVDSNAYVEDSSEDDDRERRIDVPTDVASASDEFWAGIADFLADSARADGVSYGHEVEHVTVSADGESGDVVVEDYKTHGDVVYEASDDGD